MHVKYGSTRHEEFIARLGENRISDDRASVSVTIGQCHGRRPKSRVRTVASIMSPGR